MCSSCFCCATCFCFVETPRRVETDAGGAGGRALVFFFWPRVTRPPASDPLTAAPLVLFRPFNCGTTRALPTL